MNTNIPFPEIKYSVLQAAITGNTALGLNHIQEFMIIALKGKIIKVTKEAKLR